MQTMCHHAKKNDAVLAIDVAAETKISARSEDVLLNVAQTVLTAAKKVAEGAKRIFVGVRPPGESLPRGLKWMIRQVEVDDLPEPSWPNQPTAGACA